MVPSYTYRNCLLPTVGCRSLLSRNGTRTLPDLPQEPPAEAPPETEVAPEEQEASSSIRRKVVVTKGPLLALLAPHFPTEDFIFMENQHPDYLNAYYQHHTVPQEAFPAPDLEELQKLFRKQISPQGSAKFCRSVHESPRGWQPVG